MREIFSNNLFRAELFKAIMYSEISYRMFWNSLSFIQQMNLLVYTEVSCKIIYHKACCLQATMRSKVLTKACYDLLRRSVFNDCGQLHSG